MFDIKKGKRLTSDDQTEGNTVYVGAIDSNNGVANHIGQDAIHKGNTISLSYDGSVGEAFYQPQEFWATDAVNVLYFRKNNNHEFNQYIGLFICAVLRQEKYRFSYGRKWTLDNMNKTVICLPVTKNNFPDWQFMEDYIKSLHYKPLTTKNKPGNALPLNPNGWKKFKIRDLFNVELSKGDIKLDEVDKGIIPLVSSGETNNGIVGYIDKGGDGKAEIFPQNRITLDMFGNAFYQNRPFYAVSHGRVNILSPKFDLTQNIGLFISAIINQEQYKYSYGRAVYSSVAENMDIKLPITKNNLPDWQFMEDYIKSLPYGDRL